MNIKWGKMPSAGLGTGAEMENILGGGGEV